MNARNGKAAARERGVSSVGSLFGYSHFSPTRSPPSKAGGRVASKARRDVGCRLASEMDENRK